MIKPENEHEEKLIRCARSGEIAVFAPGDDAEISAKLIRDLLLHQGDKVHPNGVQVAGAKITGTLDCLFVELRHPLLAGGCDFDRVLVLQYASIPALNLAGCNVPGIEGAGLCVAGDVFLRNKFHASGEVRLLGANIGGNLTCSGGTFENKGKIALLADRAQIAGSIQLCEPNVEDSNDVRTFHAIGEVRLLGAEIGSDLDCHGGIFENAGGDALNADGAKVSGNIFLGNSFHAIGKVTFIGAAFSGQLNCSGGTFDNKNGNALAADQAKIKGSTFLAEGFHAVGVVRLSGTEISGQLSCARGTFENESGNALVAERANIGGILDLRAMQFKTGAVNLGHASVGVLVDDAASWPANGSLLINGFEYRTIGGNAPTDARSRLEWLGRQREFTPQPYRQLAKVLREMGHGRDAREIDIARHRKERLNLSPASRVWSYVYDWTTGFGYQPWRLIWFFAALVIIGTALSYASIDCGLMTAENQEDGTLFTPLRYAVEIVSPLRVSDLQEVWSIDESRPIGFIVVAAFGILKYLGLYGSLMAAAAMTGLLKKD